MNSQTSKKKIRNIAVSAFLVFAVVITGALAFLTATDSKKNTFTVGNIKIDLSEPKWSPDYDSDGDGISDTLLNIIPGETIPKDPTITNTGNNDAYVYVMVEIPKGYEINVKNKNGESETKEHYPLFSFITNEGWILIDSQTQTSSDAYDYYLYGYNAALKPAQSTTLFDNVKFALIDSEARDNTITDKTLNDLNVNITGYGIQTDFYGDEASTAKEAWQLYVNQNEWSWPDKPYKGLYTLTYVNENNEVLAEETVVVNRPVSLYYDTQLAKTGYYFSWTDEETGEKAHTNMSFDKDTTLVASYEETGFGTQASNFFVYHLDMNEDNKPSLSVVGVDISNPTYPSASFENVIIPASINFTKPNVSGTGEKGMMTSLGCIIFPANINLPVGETISVPVETIDKEATHYHYSFSSSNINYSENLYIDNLVIPDSVKTIEESAFGRQSSVMAGTVDIMNVHMSYGVETIGYASFSNQYYLKNATLPNSLETIEDGAFGITIPASSLGLNSVNIPESVTYIGQDAFMNQTALESVKIPSGITEISDYMFYGCENLSSIEMHDEITSIGEQAFAYTNLTSFDIGESINHIGDSAFEGCENIKSINVNENNEFYSDVNGVLFNKNKTELIQYPENKSDAEYIVPDSVKKIASRAFYSLNNLKTIHISKNVEFIDVQTFTNSESLKNVYFETGIKLKERPISMFQYCTNLEEIVIPESVVTIKSSAFYGCTALKKVTASNNIKTIEFGAFNKCSSLSDVYYNGTSVELSGVAIKNNNGPLTSATIHTND